MRSNVGREPFKYFVLATLSKHGNTETRQTGYVILRIIAGFSLSYPELLSQALYTPRVYTYCTTIARLLGAMWIYISHYIP